MGLTGATTGSIVQSALSRVGQCTRGAECAAALTATARSRHRENRDGAGGRGLRNRVELCPPLSGELERASRLRVCSFKDWPCPRLASWKSHEAFRGSRYQGENRRGQVSTVYERLRAKEQDATPGPWEACGFDKITVETESAVVVARIEDADGSKSVEDAELVVLSRNLAVACWDALEAAEKLYERVEMDESIGICLSDRSAALRLDMALATFRELAVEQLGEETL